MLLLRTGRSNCRGIVLGCRTAPCPKIKPRRGKSKQQIQITQQEFIIKFQAWSSQRFNIQINAQFLQDLFTYFTINSNADLKLAFKSIMQGGQEMFPKIHCLPDIEELDRILEEMD